MDILRSGDYHIEPCPDPPEEYYVTANGCKHEVYAGGLLIEWHDGKKITWLCEECFQDHIKEVLDKHPEDIARMIGSEYIKVER